MSRIITGGTGLIGQRLVKHWLKDGIKVIIIGRSKEYIASVFGTNVKSLTWQELTTDDLVDSELIVNLAGANIGEKRWTHERKLEILNSRIETSKQLSQLISQLPGTKPRLFNASAIGVYGAQDPLPELINNEEVPIDFDAHPDFLSTIAREWETSTQSASESGSPVILLRFGIVLDAGRGALPEFIKSIKFGIKRIGSGKQILSWVAVDDVIRAIDFLCAHPNLSGPFNIVAPDAVSQLSFFETLARILHKKSLFYAASISCKIGVWSDGK